MKIPNSVVVEMELPKDKMLKDPIVDVNTVNLVVVMMAKPKKEIKMMNVVMPVTLDVVQTKLVSKMMNLMTVKIPVKIVNSVVVKMISLIECLLMIPVAI